MAEFSARRLIAVLIAALTFFSLAAFGIYLHLTIA